MEWEIPDIRSVPASQITKNLNEPNKLNNLEIIEQLIHTASACLRSTGSQKIYVRSVNLYYYI